MPTRFIVGTEVKLHPVAAHITVDFSTFCLGCG